MRQTEWRRIAKSLLPAAPEFELHKIGLIKRHPWFPEIVLGYSVSRRDAFYLEAFVMPLFIPSEDVYLDYGFRIGDLWSTTVTEEMLDAVRSAMPRLHSLATKDGLLGMTTDWPINIHRAEVRLGLSILDEDLMGIRTIAEAVADWDIADGWVEPVVARCQDLISIVEQSGVVAARARLEQHRRDVERLLGVP